MWLFVVLNGVEYEVTVLIRTRSLIAFLRQNCSLWQNLFVYEPFQSQAAIERWQSQHLPTSPYLRIHTSPSFLPSLLFPSFSFSFSFSHRLPPSLHFLLPMDSHRNFRLQTFARIRDERFLCTCTTADKHLLKPAHLSNHCCGKLYSPVERHNNLRNSIILLCCATSHYHHRCFFYAVWHHNNYLISCSYSYLVKISWLSCFSMAQLFVYICRL